MDEITITPVVVDGTDWPEDIGEPGTYQLTKKSFGGKQDGAGRPALAEDEKKVREVIYLPPGLRKKLEYTVGNKRGAVAKEIVRVLSYYYNERS